MNTADQRLGKACPLKMGGALAARLVGRNLLIIIAMAAAGLLLLVAAFLLPQDAITSNVKQSASIFKAEGDHPTLELSCESELDCFTDALILLESADQNDSSILDRALTVYRIKGHSDSGYPVPTLVEYARAGGSRSFEELGYARYWHGSLIYTKPLLCFFTIGTIRKIGLALQVLLLVCIIWRLVKAHRSLVALGYWLGYVTVSVKAMGYCLQYWPATFCMLIASLAIVLMWEKEAISPSRLSLLFTVVGATINYFDLLTFPVVTLAVPLLLLFALEGPTDPKRVLWTVALCSFSWGFAYAFMWILKWLLATVITGRNVFADAAAQGKTRSLASGEDISYVHTVARSLKRYLNNPFNIAVAAFSAYALVFLNQSDRSSKDKARLLFGLAVPALLAMAIVLLWFLGMLEHSWVHPFLANHSLWPLGFAFSLGAASMIEALRPDGDDSGLSKPGFSTRAEDLSD